MPHPLDLFGSYFWDFLKKDTSLNKLDVPLRFPSRIEIPQGRHSGLYRRDSFEISPGVPSDAPSKIS